MERGVVNTLIALAAMDLAVTVARASQATVAALPTFDPTSFVERVDNSCFRSTDTVSTDGDQSRADGRASMTFWFEGKEYGPFHYP